MVKIPTLEEMLKAGLHFGHRTSKWHPKMAPFIFGSRKGVHIIDLTKTEAMLREALEFIKKLSRENKIILFVGTKVQVQKPLQKLAEENKMPYVSEKWLGGCLTNFSVIKKTIKKYNDLREQKETGRLDKYPKKERLSFYRFIQKMDARVGGLANLMRLPDALFVWDIKQEETAVTEAKKKNIPVVAVCDTNTDPSPVNYIIPANDDATKGIKMILSLVDEALKEGKKEASEKGNEKEKEA